MTSVTATDLPQPGIPFDPDNRVRIHDTASAPWSGTGRISVTFPRSVNADVATGFVIGDRFVVTTAHTVYDPRDGGMATRAIFSAGQNGTREPFSSSLVRTWRTPSEYRRTFRLCDDYCLLVLDEPVPPEVTRYRLVAETDRVLAGATYQIAGYPSDKSPRDSMWCGSGRLTAVGAEDLAYRISTNHGQSGAAVADLMREDPVVVGIHSMPNAGHSANLAVRVTDRMIRTIEQWRREIRPM
jgi:V8-like Glu-specific endopeptidase